MKYWIADIEERNGEFEYKQAIIFKAETEAEADDTHKFYVSTWYGKDHMQWDENAICYWNDHVAVYEGRMTEIDEPTFDQMRKHGLPDLTRKEASNASN
jgi:hypothetical protein